MAERAFEITYATLFTGQLPGTVFNLDIRLAGEMHERLKAVR